MVKVTREMLENHPIVARLLNNSSWRGAAEAAINFYLEGKKCPVTSWTKSSSWQQVKYAYDDLKEQ